MFDALYIGATGMQAQQARVDTIANNLANVNTPAFKKGKVSFSDLVVTTAAPGNGDAGVFAVATSAVGVQLAAVTKVFDAGDLKKTDGPLDIAIAGDGFLELAMPDGSRAFTRGGTLKVNADGLLATADGIPLKPAMAIADNAESLVISAAGRVQVNVPGQATSIDAGQLEMVRFANTQALSAQGGNVYRASEASGEPIGGRPGEDGMGSLVQGALEGSNVRLVDEMVDLMTAQRAYEASVKVVQAADEMLGLVNGLRR